MNSKILIFGVLAALLLAFGCVGKEPTNVVATSVAGGIQLTWDAVSGVSGYNIYRSTEPGELGTKINSNIITGRTSYTDTAVSNNVKYYYTVKSVDASGAEYGASQVSAIAKIAPPQNLQITINNGAQYTSQTSVSLTLYASGADSCRFSNDGVTWSDWEGYATSKTWTLTSGDGYKEVFYQCRDNLGNTAQPVSASIYLDTTPPTVTITSPVSGGQYAEMFNLTLSVADPVSSTVRCSGQLDGGTAIEIGVIDVNTPKTITVHTNAGSRTLKVSCTDGALSTETKPITFTVIDKPAVSIVIGDGSGYTATQNVNIAVAATLASECRFSNDGVTWSSWSPYVQNVQWRLTSGEGTKYVYAQCKSDTGVESDVVHDTIILDTTPPPYISININNGASWTNSRSVVLGLYAFAASQCRYSNDEMTWSDWSPYTTRMLWTLSPGDGKKYVYYECMKTTGDVEGPVSATIVYSQVEPSPPSDMRIIINDGDTYTTTRGVHLTLHATGASQCRFQQDNYGWSDWQDYTTSRNFYLEGGSGSKTIYYQCENDYGRNTVHSSIYLDLSPPPAITDLTATVGYKTVYLKWSRPSGAVSFDIYKSTRTTGAFYNIATTSSTSYTDTQVMEGEGYSYYVIARDYSGQQSGNSNVVSVNIPLPLGPGPVIPP